MADTDPLKGKTIHIGNKTRTLKFTYQAQRVAQKALGGMTLRQALQQIEGADTLCELASAGFNGGRGPDDKVCSADKVAAWLELEPKKQMPLMVAVAEAIGLAIERIIPKGEDDGDVSSASGETSSKSEAPIANPNPKTTDGPTSDG